MRHFGKVLQFPSIAKLEKYELAQAVLSENKLHLFVSTQELKIIFFSKYNDEIHMLLYIKA